jgi:hypothetical protein
MIWRHSPIEVHIHFEETYCLHLQGRRVIHASNQLTRKKPWRWRHYFPLICRWTSTAPHGVTSKKYFFLYLFVRNWNVRRLIWFKETLCLYNVQFTKFRFLMFETMVIGIPMVNYAQCPEDGGGSGGTASCIFNHGTRWKWVVSFTPRPLYISGNTTWYP